MELHPDLILLGSNMVANQAGAELCAILTRTAKTASSLLALVCEESTPELEMHAQTLKLTSLFDQHLSAPALLNAIVKLLNNTH
jgi:hypothetical protein